MLARVLNLRARHVDVRVDRLQNIIQLVQVAQLRNATHRCGCLGMGLLEPSIDLHGLSVDVYGHSGVQVGLVAELVADVARISL